MDESVYISRSANTLEKVINPIILLQAMDKLEARLGSLTLV